MKLADVRYWPKADTPSCTAPVRFSEISGHDLVQKSAFAVAIGLLHSICLLFP